MIDQIETEAVDSLGGGQNLPPKDYHRDFLERMLYRMQLTKGARFQTARRHRRRSVASVWSVTLLSMYVFSISAYAALFDLSSRPNVSSALTLLNLVLSAFIIAFSVMEQGRQHDLKAELFLRCAQGISVLFDELEFHLKTNSITNVDGKDLINKYNALLHDFSDNHSEADFRTYRIYVGKHTGWKQLPYRTRTKIKYWVDCWGMLIASAAIPPTVLAYIYLFLPG